MDLITPFHIGLSQGNPEHDDLPVTADFLVDFEGRVFDDLSLNYPMEAIKKLHLLHAHAYKRIVVYMQSAPKLRGLQALDPG